LTSAANRQQERVRLIGQQDDERPARRLFQRLEHRVLGRRLHQLRFADDEHLALAEHGFSPRLIDEFRSNDVDRQRRPFALTGPGHETESAHFVMTW
jgi:hypothetical protein